MTWKIFKYLHYSYCNTCLFFFLDLMPPFVRAFAFKMMFRKFGSHCLIDYKSYFSYPWKIVMGNNVSVNRGCSFYSSFFIKDVFIIIKDNVSFGPECVLFSAGQNPHDADLSDIGGTIIIEEGAYIGGRSIILYGVTIGKGAVVGAGSVVTKDVAPFTIVGGSPAHQIGIRTDY